MMRRSILVHIPHSSISIPEKYKSSFIVSDKELELELLKMTDLYTDVLFDFGYESVIFPVSRLLCDVERFRDDRDENMAKYGMGAIYSVTSDGKALKKINDVASQEILMKYYDTHHHKLENRVTEILKMTGVCLIIDGHSFPSAVLPYEMNQDNVRPNFCIGSDDFHTPKELVDLAVHFLRTEGYSVAVNQPFSGSIVPMRYYKKNVNVRSIMIEINRSLYMDENTGDKGPAFQNIKNVIERLLLTFNEWLKENVNTIR